jgi:hypothetical protein
MNLQIKRTLNFESIFLRIGWMGAMSKRTGRSPAARVIYARETPMRPFPPVIKIDMMDLSPSLFYLYFILQPVSSQETSISFAGIMIGVPT